ncbi:hypothetical protein KCP78_23045 [Salmonella enterica subsp. enterica]|nr:hypothetical protein KCP78_23045 [Salmonella enterica subsp. enterica]
MFHTGRIRKWRCWRTRLYACETISRLTRHPSTVMPCRIAGLSGSAIPLNRPVPGAVPTSSLMIQLRHHRMEFTAGLSERKSTSQEIQKITQLRLCHAAGRSCGLRFHRTMYHSPWGDAAGCAATAAVVRGKIAVY